MATAPRRCQSSSRRRGAAPGGRRLRSGRRRRGGARGRTRRVQVDDEGCVGAFGDCAVGARGANAVKARLVGLGEDDGAPGFGSPRATGGSASASRRPGGPLPGASRRRPAGSRAFRRRRAPRLPRRTVRPRGSGRFLDQRQEPGADRQVRPFAVDRRRQQQDPAAPDLGLDQRGRAAFVAQQDPAGRRVRHRRQQHVLEEPRRREPSPWAGKPDSSGWRRSKGARRSAGRVSTVSPSARAPGNAAALRASDSGCGKIARA